LSLDRDKIDVVATRLVAHLQRISSSSSLLLLVLNSTTGNFGAKSQTRAKVNHRIFCVVSLHQKQTVSNPLPIIQHVPLDKVKKK